MSYSKVGGAVAAVVTALALSASAYGDGKSPNGPPGPEGNPNQPAAAQPQANAPQGPAGNETQGKQNSAAKSHGKSQAQSRGKSGQSHGKSQQSHGKSQSQSRPQGNTKPSQSHANPNPGTPRKGGREDRPAGKITICHATRSQTNPYVEITISVNGLNGHGPAADPRHHAGSWKDIIPAPAGGCPTTVTPEQQTETKTEQPTTTTTTTTTTPEQTVANIVAPAPEVAATAPGNSESAPGQQAVLGARAQGTSPAEDESAEAPGQSKVLGATASGTAPKAATAAVAEKNASGSLPFTGFELPFVLLIAAAALLGGFALRRATLGSRS